MVTQEDHWLADIHKHKIIVFQMFWWYFPSKAENTVVYFILNAVNTSKLQLLED